MNTIRLWHYTPKTPFLRMIAVLTILLVQNLWPSGAYAQHKTRTGNQYVNCPCEQAGRECACGEYTVRYTDGRQDLQWGTYKTVDAAQKGIVEAELFERKYQRIAGNSFMFGAYPIVCTGCYRVPDKGHVPPQLSEVLTKSAKLVDQWAARVAAKCVEVARNRNVLSVSPEADRGKVGQEFREYVDSLKSAREKLQELHRYITEVEDKVRDVGNDLHDLFSKTEAAVEHYAASENAVDQYLEEQPDISGGGLEEEKIVDGSPKKNQHAQDKEKERIRTPPPTAKQESPVKVSPTNPQHAIESVAQRVRKWMKWRIDYHAAVSFGGNQDEGMHYEWSYDRQGWLSLESPAYTLRIPLAELRFHSPPRLNLWQPSDQSPHTHLQLRSLWCIDWWGTGSAPNTKIERNISFVIEYPTKSAAQLAANDLELLFQYFRRPDAIVPPTDSTVSSILAELANAKQAPFQGEDQFEAERQSPHKIKYEFKKYHASVSNLKKWLVSERKAVESAHWVAESRGVKQIDRMLELIESEMSTSGSLVKSKEYTEAVRAAQKEVGELIREARKARNDTKRFHEQEPKDMKCIYDCNKELKLISNWLDSLNKIDDRLVDVDIKRP